MNEFKVGDRVRIVESGFVGEIFSVENRLLTSLDGTIEGCCIDFYEVVGENGASFRGLQSSELELIEKAIEHEKIKTQEQIKIDQLEQRIEKLEKEVFKPIVIHNRPKETKPSLLTEDERVILRNLDKKWKWIARDKITDDLNVFASEPVKTVYEWNVAGNVDNFERLWAFNHLFQFIKWTDNEPYNIEELLKGECGNDN